MRLTNLTAKKSRPTASRLQNCGVPFEKLEDRSLNAVTHSLKDGILRIVGDDARNVVDVSQASGKVTVKVGSSVLTTETASKVKEIKFWGNGGNDSFKSTVSQRTWAYGGSGNDTLISAGAADNLFGGLDNDDLRGGGGNDFLSGDEGADDLWGEDGTDSLKGGYGADEFFGGAGWDQFFDYDFDQARPALNGYEVADIKQGESPTCQTLSVLAESVAQGLSFGSDIKRVGTTSNYDVTLYGGAAKQRVSFTGSWTDNDPTPRQQGQFMEFWTILMQRARLQSLGVKFDVAKTPADWDKDHERTGGKLYSTADAMNRFLGWKVSYSAISAASPEALQKSLKNGDVIVASTVGDKKKVPTSGGLVGNHAYAVLNVYQSSGKWMVKLYNPWGRDGNSSTDGNDDGFVTLAWSQFRNSSNFDGYYKATS